MGDKRWLLFCDPVLHPSRQPADNSDALHLYLCKYCYGGLSAKDTAGAPKLRMPLLARANGLWGGPEPAELASLTYTERKIIQLARLYVSVKRVFLNTKNYARACRDDTPMYHERNVVAYPQNLDVVQKLLGVSPQRLVEVLTVQFVGSDRARLRAEPQLSVSFRRLRAAFAWLSCNSWPWMLATKYLFCPITLF